MTNVHTHNNQITAINLLADVQALLLSRGVVDQRAIDEAGGICGCLLPVLSHLIDEAETLDGVRSAVGGDA